MPLSVACLVSAGSGAQVSPAVKLTHPAKDLLSLLWPTKGTFIPRLGLVVLDPHHGPGIWVCAWPRAPPAPTSQEASWSMTSSGSSEDYAPEDEAAPCSHCPRDRGYTHNGSWRANMGDAPVGGAGRRQGGP